MAVNNHHASAILLEKKPKQRRWMTKKARPRKWTQEEDSALSAAVTKFGAKNWKHIAQFVPSRNHTQCLQRWGKVLAPDLVKGHWTQPEDDQLVRLVKELAVEGAVKSWGEVANQIAGRTSKQCRERWFNHLDPSIKRGNYTQNEDKIIMDEQAKLGNKWSIISSMLPGRTEDAVKIRWKTLDRERRQVANGGKLSSTPKKPRRPRKQKSGGSNAQQPPNNQYMDMMSGIAMGMGMMAPTFPISDGVRRMMNANATTNGYAPGAHGHAPQQQQQQQAPYGGGVPPAGGLKVETGLPDQFFDWTQQMSWHNSMLGGLSGGSGGGNTANKNSSNSDPNPATTSNNPNTLTAGGSSSSASGSGSTTTGTTTTTSASKGNRAGVPPLVTAHRYRAESLEWLEDALLSPIIKANGMMGGSSSSGTGLTPLMGGITPSLAMAGGRRGVSLRGMLGTPTGVPSLSAPVASAANPTAAPATAAAGGGSSSSSNSSSAAGSGSSLAKNLKMQQQQQQRQSQASALERTPPQTCSQQAARAGGHGGAAGHGGSGASAFPSINPPNTNMNLKDEDLDHFLTDMDLENLGGALEHRLSFG